MAIRVYECDESEIEELKKLLNYDPYTDKSIDINNIKNDKYNDVIFKRQEYEIKNGSMISLPSSRYFLYLKANEDFLKKAEELFKEKFKTVKRTDKDIEEKIIKYINDEESKANQGFGAIFG
ncbi:hypothetical protein M1278_03415 [Candidatus Marsarchaeota archaeon]|nr:hypothetical protein [Candidatus Marsarchaeota archaeon]